MVIKCPYKSGRPRSSSGLLRVFLRGRGVQIVKMAEEDRDEKIKECLKEGPRKRAEIVRATQFTDSKVGRGLTFLEKRGKVIIRKFGHQTWVALPEHKNELDEKERKYQESLRIKSQAPCPEIFAKRERHTKDLREKVIVPWREQIPRTSNDGVYIGDGQVRIRFTPETKLPVEYNEEFLFEDLRKHIDEAIFQSWDEFKKLSKEYNDKVKTLKTNIGNEIEKKINDIRLLQEIGHLKMSKPEQWRINSISDRFTDYIYESGVRWEQVKIERLGKGAFQYYQKFNSKVVPDDNSLAYSIGASGFVRIMAGAIEKEDFKKEIDRVTKEMIRMVKEDYYEEFKGIAVLRKEIDELGEDIKRSLKKYLDFPVVFEEDCGYYRGC